MRALARRVQNGDDEDGTLAETLSRRSARYVKTITPLPNVVTTLPGNIHIDDTGHELQRLSSLVVIVDVRLAFCTYVNGTSKIKKDYSLDVRSPGSDEKVIVLWYMSVAH